MKRVLTCLLAVLMLAQLCACGRLDRLKNVDLPPLPQITERPAPAESAQTAEEPEPAEATPESAPAGQPDDAALRQNVIVNFKKTEMLEYDPAEGEQLILTFSYVTPHVSIPGREAASAAINEYIAMLDETYYTGNDYGDGASDGYYGMLEQAEDNFTYVREMGADFPLEFSCERSADVERADGHVLSLSFSTYSYAGGAHGFYVTRSYVFDTETGEIVSFNNLSQDMSALRSFLVQRMKEMVETDAYLNDAIASYVPVENLENSLSALLRDGSWYLSSDALVVFSDLYEISSYAAGIQSFRFPFEELGSLLDSRWVAGAKNGSGSFTIQDTGSVENGSVPILDMLSVDDGAAQICLRSGACAYDVKISRTGYAEEAGWFYLGDTLWYCSCMENSGVQLSASIPDGYPNLALSYLGEGGELHRALISQSGENGSFLLMEEGVKFSPTT